MNQSEAIKDFLKIKRVAVVGVSRNPADYSRAIYTRLRDNGFEVYGVNPNFPGNKRIDGQPVYQGIKDIPGKPVDGAFFTTSPEITASVVPECVDYGVPRIWMHRSFGQGSYSQEAEDYCKEKGVTVISKGCVMMYCQPIDGFHRLFRWFLGCPKV